MRPTVPVDLEALRGYLHPAYGQSLAQFGAPILLPASGGQILKRQIPGSSYTDAIGCYPLFCCRAWRSLPADLERIGKELVSISLVTDPFGEYDAALLRECFGDVVVPFKRHFVVALDRPIEAFVSSHHRRNARKALGDLAVALYKHPLAALEDWQHLYATLISRHNITGIPAFSRESFERQLAVPGIVAFRASYRAQTVGIILWYVQGNVGYYHLGAYSDIGYQLKSSFALFWQAIEYYRSIGLHYLNLGAGAGVAEQQNDGLSRFKQGWSTETRMAYLCGKIFDRHKYAELVRAKGQPTTAFFPAYRAGEFG
jgi:hypothetical protein